MNKNSLDKYDITIGIECHVQLATKSKLFSGADNDARDKEPNSVVSPIDFALPGMLPVLNREAIRLAVIAGKALNSPIANISTFDRKHYFYPDLPNGYQISQMYQPIIGAGYVDVLQQDGSVKRVEIHHAHLEADAGKLTHHATYSEVDLNRVSTPLIEIVSNPDMHSPAEAKAYASELYMLMTYAGVTHGDLYHGNMRFDVNLSLAPKGSIELGIRTEIKNLNSFKAVERAAEYEANRQAELLEKGEKIVQETRGWDEASGKTLTMRSKENAQDYRYMPDADIPPIELSPEDIENLSKDMPKLPPHYRDAWKDIDFDQTVIHALLASKDSTECVERIRNKSGNIHARRVGLWLLMTLQSDSEDEMKHINAPHGIKDEYLIELANMVEANELSSTAAKEVFWSMLSEDKPPKQIASEKNLLQLTDMSAIEKIVDEVLGLEQNQKAVNDIKSGNDKVIGFLVGQVMKLSGGSANPSVASQVILQKINSQ